MNDKQTIERLLRTCAEDAKTIDAIVDICQEVIDLAQDYSGGESETLERLANNFDNIVHAYYGRKDK